MESDLKILPHDMRFFEMAKAEAEKGTFPRFKIGCVVVYRGKVISSAFNTQKPDPIQKKYNSYRNFNNINNKGCINHSIHAEIRALKHISYPMSQKINWSKVKIFTYRISPGLPYGHGMSRPCPACMQFIINHGIRQIYYSTDIGYAKEIVEGC